MPNFVFVTKTRWNEPPRIRHQLAYLLADAGHDVLFMEQPVGFLQHTAPARKVRERITVVEYRELIHHKLRLLPIFHRLNALVVSRSLASSSAAVNWNDPPTVVNFNYEYYFVRNAFPESRIVTIINDDHAATALFNYKKPLEWALSRTCAVSDRVLTVSLPLVGKLAKYCDAELFLPWADTPYRSPANGERTILLFWGYINDRLDLDVLTNLADCLARERPDYRMVFVGPVEQSAGKRFGTLSERPNVEIRPAMSLDDLPLHHVLAGLIPYRRGSGRVDAIELSNKALQLLARGLPLLISGMPHFIDKKFVFRLDQDQDSFVRVVEEIQSRFHSLQPAIREFVSDNTSEARFRQLMEIVNT